MNDKCPKCNAVQRNSDAAVITRFECDSHVLLRMGGEFIQSTACRLRQAEQQLAECDQRIAELEGQLEEKTSDWQYTLESRNRCQEAMDSERTAHEATKQQLHNLQGECGHLEADKKELQQQLAIAIAAQLAAEVNAEFATKSLREAQAEAAAMRAAVENSPDEKCMSISDGLHALSIDIAAEDVAGWAKMVFPKLQAALNGTAGRELLAKSERLESENDQLRKGAPLGPIIGACTIVEQEIELKNLRADLAVLAKRCEGMRDGLRMALNGRSADAMQALLADPAADEVLGRVKAQSGTQ